MSAYTVTVVDRQRKRTRYPMIADSWFECWTDAVNRFGLAALIMVKPFKRPA